MIATYITIDSFGTATNVTGDGDIALVMDELIGRRTPPADEAALSGAQQPTEAVARGDPRAPGPSTRRTAPTVAGSDGRGRSRPGVGSGGLHPRSAQYSSVTMSAGSSPGRGSVT